jgi:hypothetical protein
MQSPYKKKLDLLDELKYNNNFQLVANQIKKWSNKKPDNKILSELCSSLAHMGVYVANLQNEQSNFETIVNQYRKEKLEHQAESLRLAKKLHEYEKNK